MNDDPILQCEARLRAAMLTNDVAELDLLLDDALMFTTIEGTVVGKQFDLDAHRARLLRLTKLEPSEMAVQRHGNVAVVSVRMDIAGTYAGAEVGGALRYTRVWCERADGWRIVAGHMSVVAA